MIEHSVYLAEISRLLVMLVLASAAWAKTIGLGQFITSLTSEFRVPPAISKLVAVTVVSLEWLAFGLALCGGPWAQAGTLLAMVLFAVFTVVLLETVVSRRTATCHCFGRAAHPVSALDLVRNAIYLGACGIYLLKPAVEISATALSQFSLFLVAVLLFLVSKSLHEVRNLLR